ncbi:MAG: polysaccharide biosynthesis protein [Lachnospiraceae bacterium]|nr:polysaccharide biosynthesis protein [Lachnospiraceae bacterium]
MKEAKEEKTEKTERVQPVWWRIAILLTVFDAVAVNVSYFLALLLRFDFRFQAIPAQYYQVWENSILIHTVCSLLVYMFLKLYQSIWRYVSVNEMERTLLASAVSLLIYYMWNETFLGNMPVSFYMMGWIFEFISITAIRYSYRALRVAKRHLEQKNKFLKNTMVIGAGEAGRVIIKELINSEHLTTKVCCIIDDSKEKQGRMLNGVRIVGGRDDIMAAVEKYEIEQIIFAIPTASATERRDILNICKETDCELLVLPGIYQLVNGEVSVKKLRSVSVEELLGRDTIHVNLDEIMGYVQNQIVMVTGGGGSIGSELCRQIAAHNPKELIIFELYENNAYDIQQELIRNYPDLKLTVLIGSVRDTKRMNSVFEKYRPDIVYHAAAHKHVPLMEDSPNEAIKNNVFGTYKTAMAASAYGTKKFVLISTDKAVNPTNIMGATKRICEMIVQNLNTHSNTEFVAVRFGNVLGSNGSVIPLFKKQIKEGGPVTVTHPDIIRYFMTIPEAVSLVLQAGAYAKGGEIFVLDMGEPVKIDTLARNLIKLSGYTPDVDIKIEYTGLRPGEKLYEELLMSEEGLGKTANDMIYIGKPIEMEHDTFLEELMKLKNMPDEQLPLVRHAIEKMVPTYVYKSNEESRERAKEYGNGKVAEETGLLENELSEEAS